jgi:hypothetical protein
MPDLPNTDSAEVMEMSVALWITEKVWDQVSRAVHVDDSEEMLRAIYARVFKAVKAAHSG